MFRTLITLLRLTREVRRIRQILEIAFRPELEEVELLKSYSSSPLSYSEAVIDTSPVIKRDVYGQVISEEEEDSEIEVKKN